MGDEASFASVEAGAHLSIGAVRGLMETGMQDPFEQTKIDPNTLPPALRDANIALAVLVVVGPILAALLTATGTA